MTSIRLSKIIPILVISMATIIGLQTLILERQSLNIEANLDHTQTNLLPLVLTLKNAQISIIQVQQWLTDISATRAQDGLDDGFSEAQKTASEFLALMKQAQTLDPENKSTYQNLVTTFNPYYESGKKMAQAYIDGGPTSGNALMATFDSHAAKMTQAIDSSITQLNTSVASSFELQHLDSKSNQKMIYVFSGLFLAMLILMIVGLRILIVKPASYISEQLHKISDGDFTVSIDLKEGNEFGDIAQSSNRIVEQMGKNLQQITVSGMQVSA